MKRNDLMQLAAARKLIEQARAIILKIEGDDLDSVEDLLGEAIDDIDTIEKIEAPKPMRRKTGDEKLRKIVRDALRDAAQNGHNTNTPSRVLARDLIARVADLQGETVERVAQAIVQIDIEDDNPFAAERDRDDPEVNRSLLGYDPFDD